MEITPETFDTLDKYHESMVEAARRLTVARCYGIIPGTTMNVTTTIADGMVTVQIHSLEAVSQSGQLFHIVGDSFSRQLPHAKGRECYIVVHQDGEVEQEVNGTLYAKARYAYDYCSLEEIDSGCLPVSKLCLENDNWKVQELYIPPCMVLNSHPELMHIMNKCREKVHTIVHLLTNKYQPGDILPLRLLLIELDDLCGTEIPKDFCLLLKKIAWALSSLKLSGVHLPEPASIVPFNHNDILICIMGIYTYLGDFETAISVTHEPTPQKSEPEEFFINL